MKMITSFEQGSPEWKQARAGKVTASRAKDARDKLKSGAASGKQIAYACQVALERVSGQPADTTFENWQMREGHVQEPIARASYERRTGNLVDEVGAFATDDELFLYSPDGVIDNDGLLEVKTLFSPERIMTIVGNGDVSDFIDQCMFGLWLTGRQWIDLVIWVPSLDHLSIRRIARNDDYIEAMETDLIAFAKLVTQYENTLRTAIQSEKAGTALLQQAKEQADSLVQTARAIDREADTCETLTLGAINALLSPIRIDAAGLAELGFEPCATVKAAKHYPAASVPAICQALIRRLQGVTAEVAANAGSEPVAIRPDIQAVLAMLDVPVIARMSSHEGKLLKPGQEPPAFESAVPLVREWDHRRACESIIAALSRNK